MNLTHCFTICTFSDFQNTTLVSAKLTIGRFCKRMMLLFNLPTQTAAYGGEGVCLNSAPVLHNLILQTWGASIF